MSVTRKRRTPALVHHKPTGQARVRIGGRDFHLGRFGSPEAEAAYHRLLADWRETGVVPPTAAAAKLTPNLDGPTVDEVVLAFWRHAVGYYVDPGGQPAAEQDSYRSALQILRKVAGPEPAEGFGPKRLLAVQAAMVEAGWTRKYVNRSLGRVRHVSKWAVSREMVPIGDFEAVKAVMCDRHRDALDLLALAGARPSELLSLTTAGIDRTGEVWVAKLSRHRNAHRGRSLSLVFGLRCRKILEGCLKLGEPDARLFPFRRDTFPQAMERLREDRGDPVCPVRPAKHLRVPHASGGGAGRDAAVTRARRRGPD